jgi:DNA mismatch repair protein MutL
MSIRILDPITITQIAAGEVIDRPSSIIKELIENSLDAHATKIKISIEKGGKTWIQITDNGVGISPEDLPLAPARHATSKIQSLDDIYGVQTFGFRGEALASISHVANLSITSKQESSPIAYTIEAHLDVMSELKHTAHPTGTTISVSNLFGAVPVRQKFLKSDATEFSYIYDVVFHHMLIHPEVDISLFHNNKPIIDSSGLHTVSDILTHLHDKSFKNMLIPIDIQHGDIHIQGAVSSPTLTVSNRSKQWIAINGRPIKNAMLQKAIQHAYADWIPQGRFPVAVLNITMDGQGVDVNIHPQKQEVKFLHSGQLFDHIPAIIKSVFHSERPHALTELRSHSHGEYTDLSTVFPQMSSESSFQSTSQPPYRPLSEAPRIDTEWAQSAQSLYAPMPSYQRDTPELVFFQLFDTYILIKTTQGVVILDQHAVHERILHEKFKKNVQKTDQRQTLLSSEVMTIPSELMPIYTDIQNEFRDLGFVIEEFGENRIVIREIPLEWMGVPLDTFIIQFLTQVKEDQSLKSDLVALKKEKIQLMACKAAIKAGKTLSDYETRQLIQDFLSTNERDTCPHGRPVAITLDRKQLEKMFLRS